MAMRGVEARLLRSGLWATFACRLVVPWMVGFADPPSRADVLELGCGGGFDTEALVERFPQWRIVATDVDPEMVERAAGRLDRFGDRVAVEVADAADLRFADRSFDVIIALHVWHHVGRWERATEEAARVLRPDGLLILVDLLEASFPSWMRRLFPPERPYRLRELRDELAGSGFIRWRVDVYAGLLYRAVAVRGPVLPRTGA